MVATKYNVIKELWDVKKMKINTVKLYIINKTIMDMPKYYRSQGWI